MKIHSLTTGTVGYSTRVHEKQDGQSPGQSPHQNQDHSRHDSKEEEKEGPTEVNAENLEQAVLAFQADNQTQANGLHASVTGNGPGLKVVLKDDSGSVVRQLTGEEFLRLRESASREGQIRGKILDQKL